MSGVKGHLDRGNWGPQAGYRSAATFIEVTTTSLTEITLEHLIALQGLDTVFDNLLALTIDTVHLA